MLEIYCVGATFKNYRENNEDNFFVNNHYAPENHNDMFVKKHFCDKKINIFAVFDGLGGEINGEKASYIAAKTLKKYKKLSEYYDIANERVTALKPIKSNKIVGTTAVVVEVLNGSFQCSNIGDSRAYLIRNNKIIQLSKDHTSLQMMLSMGAITEEQARKSQFKNVLSQCLGMGDDEYKISPFWGESGALLNGDIILLCTDGLTGSLSDEELKCLILENDKKRITTLLYERARQCGAKDNITMLLLYIAEKKCWGNRNINK
jgi:protein phosphatase